MTTVDSNAWVSIRPRPSGLPDDLGAPELPGSKSHAQRALLLAGLGVGATTIEGLPAARDVEVLARALAALGARLERVGDACHVHAVPSRTLTAADLDCADNGTALRMLLLAVAAIGGSGRLHAAPRLQQRPLGEARLALAALGVEVGTGWPLPFDGSRLRTPGPLRMPVRAADTSQVASGAVLGLACRAARGLGGGTVEVTGAITAPLGYLYLTCQIATARGHSIVAATAGGVRSITVGAGRVPTSPRYRVPPDASAATFVAALAALHRRPRPDWPTDDGHPDWQALADIDRLAAAAPGSEVCIDDLGGRPDCFPALCAVAAGRPGRTQLSGAPALRHKESDRIAAMATALSALSVSCRALDGGLVIDGRDLRHSRDDGLRTLPAVDDHRVIMALALLGTAVPGGVLLAPRTAPGKSWPGFLAWLARVADVR